LAGQAEENKKQDKGSSFDHDAPYLTTGERRTQQNGASLRVCSLIFDGLVSTQKTTYSVIPAKAGIQSFRLDAVRLDPGLRRGDELLRVHQI
jgi:hypothetical protein